MENSLIDRTIFRAFRKDQKPQVIPHYYGDIVRIFFITGATIMVITLPFLTHRIPISFYLSILFVVAVCLTAGFTNPKQNWVIVLDFFISLTAFVAFEYFAVTTYLSSSLWDWFFWINEILAVIFFFALYFSTKTFRSIIIEKKFIFP